MSIEGAGPLLSCGLRVVKADRFEGYVNFEGVVGCLCLRDVVGMDYPRWIRYANREGLYIGHSFVEGAICLSVTYCLFEQVDKVIEEGVLLFYVESQDAVEKAREVKEILFADFFATVSVLHE